MVVREARGQVFPMEVITHRKHGVNISDMERALSVAAGGALAIVGLSKRSGIGLGLAAIGGDLIRRGITGHCYAYEHLGIRTAPRGQGADTTSVPYQLGIRVDRSVTIDKPRSEVFAFFRNFSNLPRFMKHLESVTQDGERSHWVVKAPVGKTVEWDAVVHNERPDELIAWRTLPGADVPNAGAVLFRDAPGGRGTEVRVEMQYNPPAGTVGAFLSKLFGEEPSQQIEEDLRHLKQILEVGEIVTTEGQSSGRRSDTERPERKEWAVQHASEASFPASDAPSYTR